MRACLQVRGYACVYTCVCMRCVIWKLSESDGRGGMDNSICNINLIFFYNNTKTEYPVITNFFALLQIFQSFLYSFGLQ